MDNEHIVWTGFLKEQGAQFTSDHVTSFGNSQAELHHVLTGNSLIPLTHLAILRISGTDAKEFLQGQTSNDIRLVTDGHHQLGGYCTPKGRMLALYTLFMSNNDYYLLLPAELAEGVQKRLTMFVMRSDVTIENISSSMQALSLSGPSAGQLLKTAVGAYPANAGDTLTQNAITLLRRPGQQARFICIAENNALIQLWNTLASDAAASGVAGWELLEIQAGIPSVESDTVEAFVPQMTNLQLVDGVSFKKGCYPGQEVVARMQYLGKLKRRMYRARADAPTPKVGTALFSPDSTSAQGAGKVVRAAPSPEGGCEMLVVSEIECAENGTLHLENAMGAKLELLELPYPFEQ